jgi:hypothetical protein
MGGPGWVVVSAVALVTDVAALVLTMLWHVASDTTSFALLNSQIALYAVLILGVPTIAITLLLSVRRIARVVAVVATVWIAFNAFLWLPVDAALAAWAVGAAVVVLGTTVAGFITDQVGSTGSRPQR